MINAKRQSAFIAALLFFFLSVFPIKPAKAFFPGVAFAFMTTSTTGKVALSIAGVVGLIGMYLTIEDAQENALRIPLGPNDHNKPPAPVAAPVADRVTLVGWYNSYYYSDCQIAAAPSFPSVQASSFADACAKVGGQVDGGSCCKDVNRTMACNQSENGTWSACMKNYSIEDCPPGYTVSFGTCTLVNPRKANDDKTCDILLSNGQFATADDMNCATSTDGSTLQPMIRDGKVIAYGKNSEGQPLMWEVTPGQQSYKVKQYEQISTATGTQVKETEYTVDAATSAVTGVSSSTSPGSISSPSGSGGAVPTTTDPVTQPTNPTNTPTVETRPADPIVFPNDYARTGESGRAADKVVDKLDTLTDTSSASQADPETPPQSDFDNAYFKDTFSPLLGWRLPSHSSQCPVADFTIDWWGKSQRYIMDSQCTIAEQNRSSISAIFVVGWLLLALFIILGA